MTDPKISVLPAIPYIEREEIGQYLNFDFALENTTSETIHIQKIEVCVFDSAHKLVLRKFLDGNGSAPNIQTVPNRKIEAGKTHLIFNSFHSFEPEIEIAKLRYEFLLEADPSETIYTRTVEVSPTVYEPQTALVLPLRGAFIVYDGHDFYSHHRRFDYAHPVAREIGINSNFMRFAYDFCSVDADGAMFHGDDTINENWFVFAAPVYATGAGRVVLANDEMPDNRSFDQSLLPENPVILFGNHVVIDHLNGEYSMFAHLKQNSIKVKIGDMVQQDQLIAEIGASGSANIPHLHYELRNGANMIGVEGLPSCFTNFKRRLGSKSVTIAKGIVDTGDIVER